MTRTVQTRKRRRPREQEGRPSEQEARPSKPARRNAHGPPSLIGPHEAVVASLKTRYDVVVASVISSTQIRKRVDLAVACFSDTAASGPLPPVVLLHARTAQVCKMITIVEQCKRILAGQGKAWYQYNQLFDLPAAPPEPDEAHEAAAGRDGKDSDHDEFEVMNSRFEKAVLPPPPTRAVKSMRIFLSTQAIPDLDHKDDVTKQTSQSVGG